MDGAELVVGEAVERETVTEGEGQMDGLDELAAVREVVLRAYPDVVPELVGGGSVEEVLASVEEARAAFRRVAAAVTVEERSPVQPVQPVQIPVVPAGAARPAAVDPERLPAAEKIRRGLAGRR